MADITSQAQYWRAMDEAGRFDAYITAIAVAVLAYSFTSAGPAPIQHARWLILGAWLTLFGAVWAGLHVRALIVKNSLVLAELLALSEQQAQAVALYSPAQDGAPPPAPSELLQDALRRSYELGEELRGRIQRNAKVIARLELARGVQLLVGLALLGAWRWQAM